MTTIYSYMGFTITHFSNSNKWNITYPFELEPAVYTYSLEKAYQFIEEMVGA